MQEGIVSELQGEAVTSPMAPLLSEQTKRSGPHQVWRESELQVLRDHYPASGAQACKDRLPNRDIWAIRNKARRMDLRAPNQPEERQNWPSTPHMDEMIKRAYGDRPGKGTPAQLGRQIGRPPRWVSYRARALGVVPPRRNPRWTAEEDDLIRQNACSAPRKIQRTLLRRGFRRTPGAIAQRRTHLVIDTTDPDSYTAADLATLLGIYPSKVRSWIGSGRLKAKQETQGASGSPFRIRRREVRRFVVENAGEVHLGCCDKYWLIDLLAGSSET